MPENYPVPPPPPRQNKPVPPPPPGKGPVPPSPAASPAMVPAPGRPASGPAPMPGSAPQPRPGSGPASAPGMPGMPGMPAMGGALENRMQEVERRFSDQEATKKLLENQLSELQRQLKEEHEKVITHSVKVKEEEAVSVKIDQQLRDMQDKLRREKYEQELHDARSKAELQLKELERRMTEERETWMVALKNQLKERDQVEREVEDTLTRRLADFERRYQNEKNEWITTLRTKDEETNQVRRQLQEELDKLQDSVEEKERDIEALRDLSEQQRRATEQGAQNEVRALQNQMEAQLREGSTWKAQIALLQTQLHQLELQHQEERARWQGQLDRLQQEHSESRKRIESSAAVHEDDIKREFSRRDQERAQYWEGVVAQMRSEKETLRSSLMRRDEDMTRLQMDINELKRTLDLERSRWATEADKMRRAGHEEAMRNLPEAVVGKIEAEKKKIEEQYAAQMQSLKQQLAKSADAQKALSAKLEIEGKRSQQEFAALHTQIQDSENARQTLESELAAVRAEHRQALETFDMEKASWGEEAAHVEKQTKEFLQRIAELQNQEAGVREVLEGKTREWEARKTSFQTESEALRAELTAAQSEIAAKEAAHQRFEATVEAQKTEWMRQLEAGQELQDKKEKELELVRAEIKTLAQAQLELKAAANTLRAEVVQVQGERTRQDAQWAEKEAIWNSTRGELEKKMTETAAAAKAAEEKAILAEKAASDKGIVKLSVAGAGDSNPVSATLESSPEAVRALTAIRTQMQEMQALLTWLRPVKRSIGKAA